MQRPERRGESKLGMLSPHVALKLVLSSLEMKKKKTKRRQAELYLCRLSRLSTWLLADTYLPETTLPQHPELFEVLV